MTYDESKKSFSIEPKDTESKDVGIYFIQITLIDKNGIRSDPYVLSLTIVDEIRSLSVALSMSVERYLDVSFG